MSRGLSLFSQRRNAQVAEVCLSFYAVSATMEALWASGAITSTPLSNGCSADSSVADFLTYYADAVFVEAIDLPKIKLVPSHYIGQAGDERLAPTQKRAISPRSWYNTLNTL